MKINRLFTIAAAALMMVACSSEETVLKNTPAAGSQIQFTATIAAPNSGATTRTEYSESGKNINVAWSVGDEIALIHNGVKDVATVKTVNPDGSATITGYITGATNEADVRLVYPAARVGEVTGGADGTEYSSDSDVEGKLLTQDGTLKYIQKNLDFRSDMNQLSVEGDKATLAYPAEDMAAELAIWKLTLQDDAETPAALSATQVSVILDGEEPVTIASTAKLSKAVSSVYLAMPEMSEAEATVTIEAVTADGDYTYVNSGLTLDAGYYYQSTVTMEKAVDGVDLSKLTADYVAQDGDVLTGTLAGDYKITIADGATVTLDGVTINGVNNEDYQWAGITCLGDATIILKDGTTNTVKGFNQLYPGIHVPSGKTLTINGETLGTGSLTASSNGYGAGIGGGRSISCGNIEIQGGVITATGVYNNPGIGAGQGAESPSTCGTITISGGTVTAIGGTYSAGIGSGHASENPSTCGAITISGGTVSATAGEGAPAAIGKGYYGGAISTCASVTFGAGITSLTMTNAASTGKVGNFVNATAVNVGEYPITDYLDQNVTAATVAMFAVGYSSTLSGDNKTWTVTKN